MGKEKKKKRKESSKKRSSGHLKLFSSSEQQDFTSIRQSKNKLTFSPSDDSNWQLKLFAPNEKSINDTSHLTWTIGGYQDAELKFDPLNPLIVCWRHTITVREWDATKAAEKADVQDQVITLKPEYHNTWPWPVTGATGYFKTLRCAYNSQFTNDTEILQVANLDELNTIHVLSRMNNSRDLKFNYELYIKE